MEFELNRKAIFIQIAEKICDSIMNGDYDTDQRLPSVREYAALAEVNANTVMRAYERLANKDFIYNKRGIGFFVSDGAKIKILQERSNDLINNQLPPLFKLMATLGISPDELKEAYKQFITS